MVQATTRFFLQLTGAVLIGSIVAPTTHAQVLLSEQFTGGASTTGFTIVSDESDCDWTFAPGDLTEGTFNIDFGGTVVSGGGFDGDFAFLDSDACGVSGITVNSTLVSATFDASSASVLNLSYSHQFRARLQSFCKVEVYNGTAWTEVANYTTTDVGYPNPAVVETIDITDAAGGSAAAQLRFQFSAGWDWWWALDNITVTASDCSFPTGLAVSNITTSGASISWEDNGSTGYEWSITAGAAPDGTNAISSGDGSSLTASGLAPGTPHTAFVRSLCPDGGTSAWSAGVIFTTLITNDECSAATPLIVNTEYECSDVTPGTVSGATASNITTTCFGSPDDDVWFTFTALTTTHRISLLNGAGSVTDLYHALWTGPCNALTLVPGSCSDGDVSNPAGLVAEQVYYLQVYTYTSTAGQNTTFSVCIGSDPSIGIAEHMGGQQLTLFPNPVKDQLSIRDLNIRSHHLNVMDAAGRMVTQYAAARTIDVQQLVPGTYLLVMVAKDGSIIGRTPFVKD